MLVTEKYFAKQLVNEIPWSYFRYAIIRMRRIDHLASVTSVSARVRRVRWDESKKKRNDGGGEGR